MAFQFQRGFQYGANTRPKYDTSGADWFDALTRTGTMRTHGGVGDEANQNYFTWDKSSNPYDENTGRVGTLSRLRKYDPGAFTNRVGSNTTDKAIQQYATMYGASLFQDANGNFYFDSPEQVDEQGGTGSAGFYGLLTPEVAQTFVGQKQREQQRIAEGQKRKAALRASQGDMAGETRRLAELIGQQYERGMMMPEWDRQALFSGRAGWNDPSNIALRQAVTSGRYNRWTSRMNPSAYNPRRPSYAPAWPANPGGGY